QQAGASNGAVNRELSVIKRCYDLAVQAGKLVYRPYIPMLKENNVRKGFFEREQFEAVRNHLPEHLKPIVTFAYITGWRINSDVMPLRWEQVDYETGMVRLEAGTSKNEAPREFPFTDELKALLDVQGAKADALLENAGTVCDYVFFHPDGRQIRDFRKSWRNA